MNPENSYYYLYDCGYLPSLKEFLSGFFFWAKSKRGGLLTQKVVKNRDTPFHHLMNTVAPQEYQNDSNISTVYQNDSNISTVYQNRQVQLRMTGKKWKNYADNDNWKPGMRPTFGMTEVEENLANRMFLQTRKKELKKLISHDMVKYEKELQAKGLGFYKERL